MNASIRILLTTLAILIAGFSATSAEANYKGGVAPVSSKVSSKEKCDCAEEVAVGNGTTISLSEGNLKETYAGPSVQGGKGGNLAVIIVYNSIRANGSQSRTNTVAGVGMTHTFNEYLFPQRLFMFLANGEGRVEKFSPTSLSTYVSTEGYFRTLRRTATGYTLTETDGGTREYRLVAGSPTVDGQQVYWLQRITDANGNSTTLVYTGGLLTTVTDAYNRSLAFSYTGARKLWKITDPRGSVTTFQYDSTNTRLVKITDPEGKSVSYTYDSLYQIIKKVDRDGRVFRFGYQVDKPISATDGSGASLLRQSNTKGWATDSTALATQLMRRYQPATTSRIDGNGKVWQYDYDANGYITRSRAPDGATTTYTYDPASLNVSSVADANGNRTEYTYDSHGNRTLERRYLEYPTADPGKIFETAYEYCAPSAVPAPPCNFSLPIYDRVKTITYPNGSITRYAYDAVGNRIKETRDDGGLTLVTEWSHDSHGNVLTEKDPNGHITSYEYDVSGNRVKATDPDSHVTRYFYDEVGNRACTVDGNGHVRLSLYDGLNRLTDEVARIGEQVGPSDPIAPVCDADPPFDDQDIVLAHYDYDGNGNRTLMRRQANTSTPRIYQPTAYDYDLRNRLVRETRDPGGLNLVTSYTYDGNDNRVTLTDPRVKTTQYAYDVQNRLVKVTDALGNMTQYAYDPVGNRIQETDANGHRSCSQYDGLNRLTAQTRKMDAGACGTASASDLVTRNFYDTGAPIACDHDPGSPSCDGPTPGSNNIAHTIDPEGKYTYFKYDKVDRRWITIRKVTETADTCDADDWCQYTKYDPASNVTARIDANGNRTNYAYFDNNWLKTETVDPGGLNLTTTSTYDGVGNTQTVTNPRGNVITNTYDERNQLVRVDDSVGLVATYAYEGIGNRAQECDGNNHCTGYSYDAVNRLVDTVDPLGNTALNGYDKNGNLIKATDRESHVTCHHYDDINRRTRTAQLMGGSNCAVLSASDLWTDTEYDPVGNVTRLITAKKNSTPDACKGASPPEDCEITSYQYDPADRLVVETYADETTRNFEYNKSGNLHQRTDQLGQVTRYRYNDIYYLILRDYLDPAEPDDAFEYDTGGRMIRAERAAWVVTYSYDAANRVVQTTQDATGAPMTVQYAYNTAAGTRDLIYPGGRACHEQWDLRERLVDNACDSFAGTYAYDLGNRVLTRSYNNGVAATYGYDADNRITSLTHANGGTVADFGYDYDKEGNKKFENKNHDPAKSEAYAYDDVYRLIDYKVGTLVGSTVPAPITQTQYDLDKVGNWDQFTQDDDGAGPGVPIVYQNTPNQMNEYDDPSTNGPGEIPDDLGIPNNFKDLAATPAPDGENWAHDKNGNRREDGQRIYLYDDENRLVRVTRKLDAVQTDYRYDALSRRVVKSVSGGATTRYAYDDARIVEEQDTGAVTQATYVYGNYIDEVLNMQRGGADYYYHQNALWSVVAVTNASAVVVERVAYTDYGCPTITDGAGVPVPLNPWGTAHSAIGNPWMFTGRQWDEESGLYYYRARYYDCESGRFLQRDVMEYLDSTNLYYYAHGNPYRFVDPKGKCTLEITNLGDMLTDALLTSASIAKDYIKQLVGAISKQEISKLPGWIRAIINVQDTPIAKRAEQVVRKAAQLQLGPLTKVNFTAERATRVPCKLKKGQKMPDCCCRFLDNSFGVGLQGNPQNKIDLEILGTKGEVGYEVSAETQGDYTHHKHCRQNADPCIDDWVNFHLHYKVKLTGTIETTIEYTKFYRVDCDDCIDEVPINPAKRKR